MLVDVSDKRRIRRVLLKAGLIATSLAAVLVIVGGIYLLTLPGVGDAERRVDRILALHHGTRSSAQLPKKLGDALVATEDEHF
jgi:hypothetical protein